MCNGCADPGVAYIVPAAGQVEAQLADVQPLIDAARAAVGGIKADHINEVRSDGHLPCATISSDIP